jgi:hypothetical protein
MPAAKPPPEASCRLLLWAMTIGRGWWMVVIAGSLAAGARQQAQGPDWLKLDGSRWQQMKPEARLAYVEGFLAGAAVGQAAHRSRDTVALRAELEALGRSGGLLFPFGANVYESRVNDYYWWKNHLPLPTWYAFLEVNATLGRQLSDSVP